VKDNVVLSDRITNVETNFKVYRWRVCIVRWRVCIVRSGWNWTKSMNEVRMYLEMRRDPGHRDSERARNLY
jgi:hypothetical protein